MIVSIDNGNGSFKFDPSEGIALSIPMVFGGPQPSAFGVSPATATPLEAGDFIGSVEKGGSANCDEIRIIPHCNGTHTESVGHIVSDKVPITEVLGKSIFHEATLITVRTESDCSERYQPPLENNDEVISAASLKEALKGKTVSNTLVIRTLPNDESKKSRNYGDNPPPFFTNDAMELIVSLGVEHLIVDFPSVDKAWDEGKLSNHRLFWNVSPGVKNLVGGERMNSTITEMVFIPDEVKDGYYALSIQIPNFMIDAAPSRVLLFAIEKEG